MNKQCEYIFSKGKKKDLQCENIAQQEYKGKFYCGKNKCSGCFMIVKTTEQSKEKLETEIRLTHSFNHKKNLAKELELAKKVADYAVKHKKEKLSSKNVNDIDLPSVISGQILRKYSRGNIKKATKVNLIVPNEAIKFEKEILTLIPLKLKFPWNPGKPIIKVCQVELSKEKIYITVSMKKPKEIITENVIGVDLNAGKGRHLAVVADPKNNKVLFLNKQASMIRNKYFKLRQRFQKEKNKTGLKNMRKKENNIMRDIDHKVSKQIVDYAKKTKSKIILEDLNFEEKKKKGSKFIKRLLSSWSYSRLQKFIFYKAQAVGLAVEKVPPHYTSQICSSCGKLGVRDAKHFVCKSSNCKKKNIKRNSDQNAAFNIAKRGNDLSDGRKA